MTPAAFEKRLVELERKYGVGPAVGRRAERPAQTFRPPDAVECVLSTAFRAAKRLALEWPGHRCRLTLCLEEEKLSGLEGVTDGRLSKARLYAACLRDNLTARSLGLSAAEWRGMTRPPSNAS